jgi:hypothetical protein
MDTGSVTPDEFATQLRAVRRRAWVRAILGPMQRGRAPLYQLSAVIGPQPPGWSSGIWRYEACTFAAAELTTPELADGFDMEGPPELKLGPIRASLTLGPTDQHNWRRDPSLSRFDEIGIPWPTLHYDVYLRDAQNVRLPEFLIGRGCPSFPTAGAAVNAFFFGNYAVTGTMNPSLGRADIRVVDEQARFRRVRARPTTLDIWVGGRAIRGATLELNAATYRRQVRLTKPGRVSWPLPEGALEDAWLWLKRGSDWLDYRPLSGWGYRPRDVEIEAAPRDPGAEITTLASQGESLHVEFKEKLPDSPSEKRNTFKDVVAFANGGGGTVLFGVDDDGAIVGLKGTLTSERHRLTDLFRALVAPSPPHRIEAQEVDGKRVLLLELGPSTGTLHALVLDLEKPEYYVRRAATTYYARPEEIAAVFAQ